MGRRCQYSVAMRNIGHIALLVLFALSSCSKDEVDVTTLNNNPFDPEYAGPAVFALDDTFLQTVNIGGNNIVYQIITFHVNEDLFLSPSVYSVTLKDLEADVTQVLNPVPSGSNTFQYLREPAPGISVCLELRLTNNQSTAGAETICATL